MNTKDDMDYDNLYRRIVIAKNNILFEEPCPLYEPQWDSGSEDSEEE